MGSKETTKKEPKPKFIDDSAVACSDKIVREADYMDAYEEYVSQSLTQLIDVLEDMAGEAGIDQSIHKIDHEMGKYECKMAREVFA